MSKTVILRIGKRHGLTDEPEMKDITGNTELLTSLKKGTADAKARRGRFVK